MKRNSVFFEEECAVDSKDNLKKCEDEMKTVSRNKEGDEDDGGLGVVRIKPLFAGEGGCESSAYQGSAVEFSSNFISVNNRIFSYPRHVIPPDTTQQEMYDQFMPRRIADFLDGYNVNIMAYGQTGSGKTHTVFGPPGIMERAANGEFGCSVIPEYGLCPRAMIETYESLQILRKNSPGKSFVLTASAIELSMVGNVDMFSKSGKKCSWGINSGIIGAGNGVVLDRSAKPPRMYGMQQVVLEEFEDLLSVFAAISSRNTGGTKLNDSSSRSHCFVILTLFVHDQETDVVFQSRFQFCDLAGSERLEDAHGDRNVRQAFQTGKNMDMLQGMITNYSLMMLSACVRALIQAQKKRSKFSFRLYMFDLILLLQESMTGAAVTASFVCVSQAPDNAKQSSYALDFGAQFSRLEQKKKKVTKVPRSKYIKRLKTLLREAEAALATSPNSNFAVVREAQVRDCHQLLSILGRFSDVETEQDIK